MLKEEKVYISKDEKLKAVSCQTINFGNISNIQNLVIIINGSRERIGFPDITTRSPVMYLRMLFE